MKAFNRLLAYFSKRRCKKCGEKYSYRLTMTDKYLIRTRCCQCCTHEEHYGPFKHRWQIRQYAVQHFPTAVEVKGLKAWYYRMKNWPYGGPTSSNWLRRTGCTNDN